MRHAVSVRDLTRGRLVALAHRDDARAGGLERGHVRTPEAEPDDGDGGR